MFSCDVIFSSHGEFPRLMTLYAVSERAVLGCFNTKPVLQSRTIQASFRATNEKGNVYNFNTVYELYVFLHSFPSVNGMRRIFPMSEHQ